MKRLAVLFASIVVISARPKPSPFICSSPCNQSPIPTHIFSGYGGHNPAENRGLWQYPLPGQPLVGPQDGLVYATAALPGGDLNGYGQAGNLGPSEYGGMPTHQSNYPSWQNTGILPSHQSNYPSWPTTGLIPSPQSNQQGWQTGGILPLQSNYPSVPMSGSMPSLTTGLMYPQNAIPTSNIWPQQNGAHPQFVPGHVFPAQSNGADHPISISK